MPEVLNWTKLGLVLAGGHLLKNHVGIKTGGKNQLGGQRMKRGCCMAGAQINEKQKKT